MFVLNLSFFSAISSLSVSFWYAKCYCVCIRSLLKISILLKTQVILGMHAEQGQWLDLVCQTYNQCLVDCILSRILSAKKYTKENYFIFIHRFQRVFYLICTQIQFSAIFSIIRTQNSGSLLQLTQIALIGRCRLWCIRLSRFVGHFNRNVRIVSAQTVIKKFKWRQYLI